MRKGSRGSQAVRSAKDVVRDDSPDAFQILGSPASENEPPTQRPEKFLSVDGFSTIKGSQPAIILGAELFYLKRLGLIFVFQPLHRVADDVADGSIPPGIDCGTTCSNCSLGDTWMNCPSILI